MALLEIPEGKESERVNEVMGSKYSLFLLNSSLSTSSLYGQFFLFFIFHFPLL